MFPSNKPTSLHTNICQVSSLILFPLYTKVSPTGNLPAINFVRIWSISFPTMHLLLSFSIGNHTNVFLLHSWNQTGQPPTNTKQKKKLIIYYKSLGKTNIQKFRHLVFFHVIDLVFSTAHPPFCKVHHFLTLISYRFCFSVMFPLLRRLILIFYTFHQYQFPRP